MEPKPCKVCGVTKPLEAFYETPGTRDGRRGDCIDCNLARKARRHAENPEPARRRAREWNEVEENRERTRANHERYKADGRKAISNRKSYLKRKYGITLEQYDEMLRAQGGVCAICTREPHPTISLHVDHDHETGALRGLLCFPCNQAIGSLREDPFLLRAAADYLDDHDPEVAELHAMTRARIEALRQSA
jgi:hypothetical protein